ncbi:GDP-L-fucose synthase [Caldichromatium japonicum]|uniref:GDP-L-fucose synthase n=1 Tax=Caldichromatium japonicum TaxID=2699430 RepID=A0A6G7V9T5_9GAMM|nr:GDP-L-fucose synthase [Caldichromatium japonicum]QIK36744.1 GDP-L-fucose synthase [Caldichromatium japonicum]
MTHEGLGPVYVAGHRGLVGSAILRALARQGVSDVLTRTHAELDLTDQAAVERFFASEPPYRVYLAAAKVGGILANDTYPAEFIYQNLMITAHVVHAAWRHGVERLLFLGSSCIYPPQALQPLREEALLSGPLEPTNEPYAIAKIAGIKLCESYNRQYGTDFRSLMPTNLYGPGDNFDLNTSHVIPALIRKFHEAKAEGRPEVVVWGSGQVRREFLHVDDLAAACLFVMDLPPAVYRAATSPRCSHLNVGSGEDIAIADLAALIGEIVGFTGAIRFDPARPEGPPRKQIDSRRLYELGWQPRIGLREGLAQTYAWYLAHQAKIQGSAR